jgi:site-specific DNA recombinase
MLGTAQLESENTSQRIKFVMANRVANGGAINGSEKLPLGYKVSVVDGSKRVVKDEQAAPIVMDLFDHYRRTQNQHELGRYLKDQYGLNIWQPNLTKLLHNTMYYGEYRGNPNYCEPYLTKSEWDAIQRIKPVYAKRSHNNLYLFRGLLRCPECGRTMNARYKQTGQVYYSCQYHLGYHQCGYSKSHRQDRIEAFLLDNIKPMLDAVHIESKNIKRNAPKTQNRVKSLEAKLDRLKNLYIEGDISKEIYAEKRDKVKIELEQLNADRTELDYDRLNAILDSGWRAMYDYIDPEDKAQFWRTLLHHIEVLPDGTYKLFFNW